MKVDDLSYLESQFADVDTDVEDFSKWETLDLLDLFHDLTDELGERKEILYPNTSEGRELHSMRGAVGIILRGRGAL